MAKSKKDKAAPPEEVPTRKPLLELQQLDPVSPEFITIDGATYDLANRDAWGLLERLRVKRLSDRLDQLEALKEEPSPAEQAEYLERLRALVQIVVPALPEDLLARLQPGHLSDVWHAFLANQLTRRRVSALMAMMGVGGPGIV